jgi:hypothetical protein
MQSGSGTAAFTPEQAAIVRESAAKSLGMTPTLETFAALPDEEPLAATAVLVGSDLATAAARDPRPATRSSGSPRSASSWRSSRPRPSAAARGGRSIC